MKSILTTVSTAAATAALTSMVAFSQAPATPAVQPAYTAASQAGQTQMEGRIVSLFDYLSSSTGAANVHNPAQRASEAAARARSAATTTAQDATQQVGQQLGQPQAGRPQANSDSTLERGSTPTGAWSAGGASAGQPIAFVSQRSASSSAATGAAARPAAGTAAAHAVIPGSGEVYVLVYDPNNEASRAAFAQAQWLVSGNAKASTLSSTANADASDRLAVSGRDEADRNARPQDRAQREAGALGSAAAGADYASTHIMGGKHVKITGRVLNKGNVRAIELASVEDASPAASTTTTPRTTEPSRLDQNQKPEAK